MRKIDNFKLSLLIFAFIIMSCNDDTIQSLDKKEQSTNQVKKFKGLVVNHRFDTSLEEIKNTKKGNGVFGFYKKERSNHLKTKGIAFRGGGIDDLSTEVIAKMVEEVSNDFPYANNISQEINADMIRNDFPGLSDEEIEKNIEIIEEYYQKNLDYVVFGKLAKRNNNNELMRKPNAEYAKISCLRKLGVIKSYGGTFGVASAYNALWYAWKEASKFSKEAFPGTNSKDNKQDAYRHVIWSALLCHYYRTISSKTPKLRFAKAIGDANEKCVKNREDSEQMDYHNNAIGRNLYDRNTPYRKFLWMVVGLRSPKVSVLKDETYRLVQNAFLVTGNTDTEKANKIKTGRFDCYKTKEKRWYMVGPPMAQNWRYRYVTVEKCNSNRVVYLKK